MKNTDMVIANLNGNNVQLIDTWSTGDSRP